MKTLVIVLHPYPDRSNAIKSLENIVQGLPGVTVRNLESLYGDDISQFDVAAEQAAYEGVERVIFMFPIHWFNLTPMLKAYLNAVWSYGWAFGPEGTALKNKEMLVITTAGATQFTYSKDGLINSTIDEVLTPMKSSALYVGMTYAEPIAFYEAMAPSVEKLNKFKRVIHERLAG
ncbi:NAD(P)H-dependent oxidoreductase [uncultured Tolumonas sp.]|uniref:NAD(P)H-dependent oxidoreductase n=1 Tax=uncultured Tolumonas sp. TaxID=263765 RepID=UPI00292D0FE5|nr:NAD(P)H-dependent oxidoreductase [uncultured Tolumonas sp.]